MITSTHTIENLSKKFKCNECKKQNPPPIWRRVTQWKPCEEILQTWGKKSSKSYGVVVFSRTSYIAHPCGTKNSARKKLKFDVYVTRKKLFQIVRKRRWTSCCFWKRDGWISVWIKSFWRERERERERERKRRLPTAAAAAAIYWQREESVELGARIFGAMRDARVALLRRGVFIQREVHKRNSGLARKLGARSRLDKCAVEWNPPNN
jgi:hypothetical protein